MSAAGMTRGQHVRWARVALRDMQGRAFRHFAPPVRVPPEVWPTKFRKMSGEESAITGTFSWDVSPALREIVAMAGAKSVRKIVAQKSAQVGWTAGVVCNILGYTVHQRPGVAVIGFPRAQAAKDFASEKLDPMIRSTPVLNRLIELRSRAKGNSALRKHFPGGLLKLLGMNSPSDVKSTSARTVIVEEPDDTPSDLKGQGNSLKLIEERAKTYPDHLILIGGTGTAKGASAVEEEMLKSDQRYFHVPCHSCGETHVPKWEHVTIPEAGDDTPVRAVYGRYLWEQAYYSCPHCATIWTDDERIANLRRAERDGGGWVPTVESTVPGYYINELLSTFDGSRVPVLARKYLEAKAKMDAGDVGDMIAFWNSTLGLTWEYRGELPPEDELRQRAEPYAEWSCPVGGLVPVMTVDVQHDRLAVTVWVIGRGEEMWLAYWGEHHGQTMSLEDGVWAELAALMERKVRHATGVGIPIAAVGIDSSDGQTSDAVYGFVREHSKRGGRPVLALKGAPDDEGRVEIWSPVKKKVDPNKRATKADRYGVTSHQVGTAKAKDLILGWSEQAGRVRLTGNGPGRMHWYESVRDDFFGQLLGAIKIPSRTNPRKRVWRDLKNKAHEVLDCTVYATYLSRHLRLHLRKPAYWDGLELALRQAPLLPELSEERGDECDADVGPRHLPTLASDIVVGAQRSPRPMPPVAQPASPGRMSLSGARAARG